MDINNPRSAAATAYVGRPETALYREAVSTELPYSQRVAQLVSAGAASAADDRRPGDGAARQERAQAERKARMQRIADAIREDLQNRVDQDEEADMLVYRTVDTASGQVVSQYPDDVALKLRAYARELEHKEEAKKAQIEAEHRGHVEKVA
jgi:uncharacterized FlaG/YvyC family protein